MSPASGHATAASPPALAEIKHCQLCGCESQELCFAEPPWRVVRCPECSLVYVTPRLQGQELAEVYGEGYWRSESPKSKGYADYRRDGELYLKTFRRRLAFVHSVAPRTAAGSARILDVGCAAGFFLRVMRERGHDVRGVELSPAIAATAQQHLGKDRVYIGTLDSLPTSGGDYAAGSFDLVTMWDVIEHVPDPQALLRQARSMLRPDGVLILETQNVQSMFARLLGRRWQHYKHQEHLYHFNPTTIRKLLSQSGFTVQRLTGSYGGKYVSFEFISERAARLGKIAAVLFSPLQLFRRANVYLNFRDEMVIAATPSP